MGKAGAVSFFIETCDLALSDVQPTDNSYGPKNSTFPPAAVTFVKNLEVLFYEGSVCLTILIP